MGELFKTDIDIPTDAFGIGFKLSGGADSSIVYYAVCKELARRDLKIPVYVTTLDTDIKLWYSHYAKKVINFTANETGVSPVNHITNYISGPYDDDRYTDGQDIMVYNLVDDRKINVLYSGLTQNAKVQDLYDAAIGHPDIKLSSAPLMEWCINGTDPTRNDHSKQGYRGIDRKHASLPFWAIYPFLHHDKKYVAEQYKDYDVMEKLFPLTYSCEHENSEIKTKLDIVDGFQEHAHCGQCWFCIERVYGFGKL